VDSIRKESFEATIPSAVSSCSNSEADATVFFSIRRRVSVPSTKSGQKSVESFRRSDRDRDSVLSLDHQSRIPSTEESGDFHASRPCQAFFLRAGIRYRNLLRCSRVTRKTSGFPAPPGFRPILSEWKGVGRPHREPRNRKDSE